MKHSPPILVMAIWACAVLADGAQTLEERDASDAGPASLAAARELLRHPSGVRVVRAGHIGRRMASLPLVARADQLAADWRIEQVRAGLALQQAARLSARRDPVAAVAELERAREGLQSRNLQGALLKWMAVYAFQSQSYTQALRCLREASTLQSSWLDQCNQAAVYLMMGAPDEARRLLSAIPLDRIEDEGLAVGVCFNWACYYSVRGDQRAALRYLNRAANINRPALRRLLADPQLDTLRGEKGFQVLQQGAPWEAGP